MPYLPEKHCLVLLNKKIRIFFIFIWGLERLNIIPRWWFTGYKPTNSWRQILSGPVYNQYLGPKRMTNYHDQYSWPLLMTITHDHYSRPLLIITSAHDQNWLTIRMINIHDYSPWPVFVSRTPEQYSWVMTRTHD